MDNSNSNSNKVIVSRHPACIEFILTYLGKEDVPVLSSVTEEDVKDKIVYGNIPMNLASKANLVFALEFTNPPRGQEYDLQQMFDAGAKLVPYKVIPLMEEHQLTTLL